MQPFPLTRDLVMIGGGHAHALMLRMWGMNPLPGVRVTVINPGPVAPYTGMLPGHVAGHYSRDELMIDLVRLARHAGARVILGRAVGIDRADRRVLLAGGDAVAYDIASLDVGITSDLPDVPGFADHAVAAKPLGGYAARWQEFVAQARPAPRVVIIGAGVAGVELALASAHRLQSGGAAPDVTVLERSAQPLPGLGRGARAALLARVQALGVRIVTGAQVARITASGVILADGRELPSDFTLGAAGAQPQGWLATTRLDLTNGFVAVGPTLQSSDPAIFAVGDCAHMAHAPRPKAGVFAVRQAPVLLHNLRVALSESGRMRPYHPQRDYLKLVSTGGKAAVADKFGLRLEGAWLWRWKDRIDRRFMAKFAAYPAMPSPPLPPARAAGLAEALGAKPLCGGCGAKVGAADLATALARLPPPQRPEVLSGPGDDAAVLRVPGGMPGDVQVITTDHLRAFTHDPALMSRIAAVHALGDIWAMGAAPQVALAQVILPRMAPRMQAETLREIMAAASDVFTAAGADVVGGHTSVGDELTLGFTVTGLAPRIIAKGGARPGDALILTKALGTGTILAAEMAQARLPGLLLGECVTTAFTQMCRPLGPASAILTRQAHAMTDVTGFGLAGHLLEMLAASGTAATLNLSAIPLLPGAEALAAAGHGSSLAPANRAATAPRMTFTDSARAALLFDPQTAGGLLAAVPGDQADALLRALYDAGEIAAIIGTVTSGAVWLTVQD
ncbi:selenide, water dikinase SelD [Fertoebacter nigrum]|uniref:Selenide, water dikinase SelD n=1 Tax=Fertoeibacter niger TaxID=2656921 RepID=A0A8X8KKW0_9RHOB|nr:selenide, water dikinase SelD [Fertoeibacter niger]NUB44689.1 selenide, water dikinase SelD [Fertoeibacter niger]